MSWTPEHGRQWQTGGYGNPPTVGEIAEAKRALNLLNLGLRHAGKGKKVGDGRTYSDEEFLIELDKAIRESQAKAGRAKPDRRTVQRRMGLMPTSFYNYVQRASGRRWSEVAAEYERDYLKARNTRN